MQRPQTSPAEAGPDASATAPTALTLALGLLALALSLIAMAMSFARDLGATATAALIGADLVLVGAMGALLATLRPRPTSGAAADEAARRVREEELLDALEPLGPSRRPGDEGR
ncbi:hypothetical protein ABZY44_28035 [Streptomyces sp. NPDC006544]|uniref:hypothetical protein n=1 Tax=Streptomyces sp. NPDC006544 TaxID=3154583 RepID=UPI0033AFC6BF